MSISKYEAFVNAVKYGSLTNAAKVMGYSQPGISKMIDSLEKEFDMTLFLRNGSSLELTDNGKNLLSYFQNVVKSNDDLISAVNALKGILIGNVHIGAPNSIIQFYVPNIIKAYSDAYPLINIYLDEMPTVEVVHQLKTGNIDIGFTSEFKESGLEFIPLFQDHVKLIMHKEHPFAAYDKVSIKMLNNTNFISLPPEGRDLIDAVKTVEKFSPLVRFIVHSDSAAISMVASRLGVYIISEMQCRFLPENVVSRSFEENVIRIKGIGLKSRKNASPAVKEMVKIAYSQIEINGLTPVK